MYNLLTSEELIVLVKSMDIEDWNFPPADAVEDAAEAMPPKPPLRAYLVAMRTLREKDYSYQEIADWLTGILKVKIKRNQIAYLLTAPREELEGLEREEDDSDRADAESGT